MDKRSERESRSENLGDTGKVKSTSPKETEASSGSNGKRSEIDRIRLKAWLLLLVSEVILGLLVMGQILSFRNFVLETATSNAKTELQFLQLEFKDVFSKQILGIEAISKLQSVKDHLAGDHSQQVLNFFQQQAETRRLHFLTLLDSTGTIVVGAHANRTGEKWNPAQILDTFQNPSAQYVMKTAVITLEELYKESPPVLFEGALSYEARQLMRLRGTDGLVQYIAVPVMNNNSTSGYIIAGDIISGDTILLENSVKLFGSGYGSILFRATNGSAINAVELFSDKGLNNFEEHLSESSRNDIINKAFSDNGVHVEYLTLSSIPYVLAFVRIQPTQISTAQFTSQQTPGVLVVGHPLDDDYQVLEEVISTTLAFSIGAMLLDVVRVVVSVRIFIDPLSRLVYYVKARAHNKYQELLSRIHKNLRFIYAVVVAALIPVILLVCMTVYNSQELPKLFNLNPNSARQMRLLEYAYMLGPIRNVSFICLHISFLIIFVQSLGQSVLIDDQNLKSYLSNTSDSTLEATILAGFTAEMNSRKIEFVTLVGTDSRIILGVNNNRSGEVFDPSGVVSHVLATNQRIVVTSKMINSEFRLEGAKRWL
jgi:hypothetical protein